MYVRAEGNEGDKLERELSFVVVIQCCMAPVWSPGERKLNEVVLFWTAVGALSDVPTALRHLEFLPRCSFCCPVQFAASWSVVFVAISEAELLR